MIPAVRSTLYMFQNFSRKSLDAFNRRPGLAERMQCLHCFAFRIQPCHRQPVSLVQQPAYIRNPFMILQMIQHVPSPFTQ
ncbi:hypothetical protein D3C73_1255520 [compost metagenome]